MAERCQYPADWRELAQRVAEAPDPEELIRLVQELNRALDAEEAGRKIATRQELVVRQRRTNVEQ